MNSPIKENIKSESFWIRTLFMIFFLAVNGLLKMLVGIVTVAQWLFYLFTRKPNDSLLVFASSLGQYIAEIVDYLSYNSNEKPFPFKDWPKAKSGTGSSEDE